MGVQEIPVHPQVAAHFKLSWHRPDMTWLYGTEKLTTAEYVDAYASNRPIFFRPGTHLLFGRALTAIRVRDFPEAERLLLKGASTHTTEYRFLRQYAQLKSSLGQFQEAERIVRYALTLYPRADLLHSDLATLLLLRGFCDQARPTYETALRINPTNTDARHNLERLTASQPANLWQPRQSPTVFPPYTSPPKPRLLLYGNCQAIWLSQTLQISPAITDNFDLRLVPSFGTPPPDNPLGDPDYLRSVDLVVWQTAAGAQPPEFLSRLRPDCRQIRYPAFNLKFLWPTHTCDPRQALTADMRYGRYAFGDSLVLRLLNQGVPASDIPRRYLETDLNKIVSLDRLYERTWAELRYNDLQSDIAITPWLEASFRQRQLFASINHPAFYLLDLLQRTLLGLIFDTTPDLSPTHDPRLRHELLGAEEIPLHPQIISHFQLSWARPDQRYRYRSAYLTIEEYLAAYAAFTPIPYGDPPKLFLDRAQQACRLGDPDRAEFFLLQAAALYPQIPDFAVIASHLIARQPHRLQEAETPLRVALQNHPDSSVLHQEIGQLLSRQGCKADADTFLAKAHQLASTPR